MATWRSQKGVRAASGLTRKKKALFSVLFSLILASLCLLLLEVSVRLIPALRQEEPVVPGEIGRFDARLGWSLRPGARAISRRTGQPIEYRINSRGLRDDETDYPKPKGVFRIVLLGDSRTFGYGVPLEKHFSSLLEGYFQNVDVVNMGVGGFGIDQELLYLQSEGIRYEPDLVLVYVAHYGNSRHMHTERFGKQKPAFRLEEGKLTLMNSPVPPPKDGVRDSPDRWLSVHSRVYALLKRRFVRSGERSGRGAVNEDKQETENPAFMADLYRLGEELVFAMHEEAQRHGAAFVLVTQIGQLHEAMKNRGVLSLDVSAALDNRRFALPGNLHHINEAGNGVLAWEIAQFLKGNDLVPRKLWSED